MTERLDGRPVADRLVERTQALLGSDPPDAPCLASVHLARATAFSVFLRRQERAADRLGIQFRSEALSETPTAAELRERIRTLDRDPSVHAVLVEHPLPEELDFIGATAALRPEKDVDGVGSANLGRLVAGLPLHVPAVARAALEILRHYRIPVAGRGVTVLGRSSTVGLPIALLLLARGERGNATVTIAHSQTPDLAKALQGAEVLFSCVGHPGLLNRSNVPRDAVVVDVGLSMVADPARPAAVRGVGDVDSNALEGWASAVTPVPGGVGPVSVAALMLGVAEAWSRRGSEVR
ncbi:MAG: bifunctional 5,10-methylenetetrahydrofolate dehydrogenase/5,10-methenyltetrahydrofolate cyclohydrolase [Thermoplasmata archaeon]|nr:bifunctional 5,10-methylenetetrahydrofolate dehydrogenase/5,10-methenyltetrahydrofolate cyclohydrolase [Thermoplasmata archaeon]MCI4359945.1 bifunctional 5,10-methylenetetrahydrofolate dehydrogenase/5,10-methenyltetrahydrofolate cyclohydrolase [Thermoplasmata archaeon]